MGDISITAGNVIADADGLRTEQGIAGATLTAGMVIKYNPSTKKWDIADGDLPILLTDKVGICLTTSSLDQPVVVQLGGTLAIGGTAAAGVEYAISLNAGLIALEGDVTQGKYKTRLAQGISATKIRLGICITGVAVA
jgi:hypothetical protein